MEESQVPRLTFTGEARPRENDATVIYAIVILGAIVAVPEIMWLLGVATLDVGGGSHGSALGVAFAIAYATLGIGLMLRKEAAREIFCVLAAISVILIGVAIVSQAAGGSPAAGSSAESAQAALLRRNLAATEADTALPERLRIRVAAEDDARIKEFEARYVPAVERGSGGYGRFVPGLILTLLPLWFLTRLRVRRVFS